MVTNLYVQLVLVTKEVAMEKYQILQASLESHNLMHAQPPKLLNDNPLSQELIAHGSYKVRKMTFSLTTYPCRNCTE